MVLNWVTPDDLDRIDPLPDRSRVSFVVPVCPTADRAVMEAVMRPVLADYLQAPAYAEQQRRLGRGDALAPMWEAWAAGDRRGSRSALPATTLDELVVWGDPRECRTRLAETADRTGARPIAVRTSSRRGRPTPASSVHPDRRRSAAPGTEEDHMQPFRFAVGADAPTAEGWRDMVRRVEDLGYSTLFVADHVDLPAGGLGYPEQHLAVIPAMTAAAAWTTTLEIGARVICTDYHVLPTLAQEAATIDLLSGGRLLLGLGGGWHADEYAAVGLNFGAPGRRVQKLEEMVELVKAHVSTDPIAVDGEFVQVHGTVGLPAAVGGRHPRLMIGGSKPRAMRLAGRDADVVSLSNVVAPGADPAVDIPRQLGFVRDAAGERFDSLGFELMATYVDVTDDVEGGLARAAARRSGSIPSSCAGTRSCSWAPWRRSPTRCWPGGRPTASTTRPCPTTSSSRSPPWSRWLAGS